MAIPRETVACDVCRTADFSASDLRAEGATSLSARLRQDGASLRRLDVGHNAIGASGVRALASALSALPQLTHLALDATVCGDAGACALVDALHGDSHCPRLRELGLMGASIKNRGADALARLLGSSSSPPHLTTLGLGWNAIHGDAARALAAAAVGAQQLERFCALPIGTLRRGQLPPVPPLSERDQRRRPAFGDGEELQLNGCGCGAPGAFAVAALLPRLPTTLKAVAMAYQDLGDEGAEAVAAAAAARCASRLAFLMLSRNDVGHEAAGRIRAAIPHLDDFHLRINNRGG